MSGVDPEQQVPQWLVWAAGILGPSIVWLYIQLIKPLWERRAKKEDLEVERERLEDERLHRAIEKVTTERDALFQSQVVELREQLKLREKEIMEVRVLHEHCRQETAHQAVVLAQFGGKQEILEERLRSAQERINGLSNENAQLRKKAVGDERRGNDV